MPSDPPPKNRCGTLRTDFRVKINLIVQDDDLDFIRGILPIKKGQPHGESDDR